MLLTAEHRCETVVNHGRQSSLQSVVTKLLLIVSDENVGFAYTYRGFIGVPKTIYNIFAFVPF